MTHHQLRTLGFEEVPYDPQNPHPAWEPWNRPPGLPPSSTKLAARLISEGAWQDLLTLFALYEDQENHRPRWACPRPWCKGTGDWWISIHGTLWCASCYPPAGPALVALTGTRNNAPPLDLVTGKPLLETQNEPKTT